MVGGNKNNSYPEALGADINGQVQAEFETCSPEKRQENISYVRID